MNLIKGLQHGTIWVMLLAGSLQGNLDGASTVEQYLKRPSLIRTALSPWQRTEKQKWVENNLPGTGQTKRHSPLM